MYCNGGYCGRNFFSKQEKVEALKNYKETLENELTGVSEALKELEKKG